MLEINSSLSLQAPIRAKLALDSNKMTISSDLSNVHRCNRLTTRCDEKPGWSFFRRTKLFDFFSHALEFFHLYSKIKLQLTVFLVSAIEKAIRYFTPLCKLVYGKQIYSDASSTCYLTHRQPALCLSVCLTRGLSISMFVYSFASHHQHNEDNQWETVWEWWMDVFSKATEWRRH